MKFLSTIEKVGAAQLEELGTLCRETFFRAYFAVNTPDDMQLYLDTHFSAERLSSELCNPESEFYIVRINEQAAGYVKLNFRKAQSEMQTENSCEIQRLYILEKFQNHGLGAALLDFTRALARKRRLAFIWLGVWQENKAAVRFYERNGYTIFATHDFRFGDDLQSDWLMKYTL